jgi:hypothetical protein
MRDLKWSDSETKIARRAFDAAVQRERAAVMSRFKELAASASTPQDMWAVEDYLTKQRRQIDAKYDYRYSQLIFVFGRLLREQWVKEEELKGLSEEKLAGFYMRRIAEL